MSFKRESVYDALFRYLKAMPAFTTVSRSLRHWDQVPPEEQPYLGISQASEHCETITGLHSKWTWRLDLYLYCHDEHDNVSSILNPLLDDLCEVINAVHPITGKNQLGLPDEVQWCRVQGDIDTDEGTLGSQAVAIIPVIIYIVQQP